MPNNERILSLIQRVDQPTFERRQAKCAGCPMRSGDKCAVNRTDVELLCWSAYAKCPKYHWAREQEPRRSEGQCPSATERPIGLGDVVAILAGLIGIAPKPGCGCGARRAWLNKWTPGPIKRLLTLAIRRASRAP